MSCGSILIVVKQWIIVITLRHLLFGYFWCYILHILTMGDFLLVERCGVRLCSVVLGYLRCLAAGRLRVHIHLKLSRRDPGKSSQLLMRFGAKLRFSVRAIVERASEWKSWRGAITSAHTYIHTYIHTCIHTYIHTYIHTFIHTCLHTYIHTYTRTCIYLALSVHSAVA